MFFVRNTRRTNTLFSDCVKNVPQPCRLLSSFPGNRCIAEQLCTFCFFLIFHKISLILLLYFLLSFLFFSSLPILYSFFSIFHSNFTSSFLLPPSLPLQFLSFYFFFFIPVGVVSGINHSVRTVRYYGGTYSTYALSSHNRKYCKA